MKIYVFGNGFDLAHPSINSSYGNYYDFIKRNANSSNGWDIILDFYEKESDFWSDAETNICKINPKLFIEHKETYGFSFLDILLNKIRDSFEKFMIEIEDKIIKLKPQFTLDTDSFFITFNYSSTLEEVYGIPTDKIIHLHNTTGDAILRRYYKIDEKELILGHGPYFEHYFFYKDHIIGGDKEYIDFRNKTLKNTTEIIKKTNLKLELLARQHIVDDVIFYGFSFSPNDKEYIELLSMCLCLPRTKFKVYYYVKENEIEEAVKDNIKNKVIKSGLGLHRVELIKSNGVYKI